MRQEITAKFKCTAYKVGEEVTVERGDIMLALRQDDEGAYLTQAMGPETQLIVVIKHNECLDLVGTPVNLDSVVDEDTNCPDCGNPRSECDCDNEDNDEGDEDSDDDDDDDEERCDTCGHPIDDCECESECDRCGNPQSECTCSGDEDDGDEDRHDGINEESAEAFEESPAREVHVPPPPMAEIRLSDLVEEKDPPKPTELVGVCGVCGKPANECLCS